MTLPKLPKRKHNTPRLHGAADQEANKTFVLNRSWLANQWILLATPLIVLGLGVISYAAFALPLSAPAGYIDYPAPNATIGGNGQYISGWAVALSPIDHVDIVVNDVAARASYGTGAIRPDVCAQYPQTPNCANGQRVGWQYYFNSANMPNGTYKLYAVFYGSSGGVTVSPTQYFTVANHPPAVYIDTPSEGQIVTGTINVGGWAVDSAAWPESGILSLGMSIDGVTNLFYPIYGGSRPDVCAAYPGRPNCPNVGFNYQLNTALIPNGWKAMHLTVTDLNGMSTTYNRIVYFSNAVTTPPTGPGTNPGGGGGTTNPTTPGGGPIGNGVNPDGFVDHPVPTSKSPTPYKGVMTFDGWAIDAQTAISKVNVVVDGKVIGAAKYGQGNPRPDICASHAGWFNCKNVPGYVGWQMTYDSSNISNGAHKVHAVVYDSEYPQHTYTTPDISFTTSNSIVTPPANPANLPPDVYIDNINDPGSTKSSANGWALDNVTKAESVIKKVTVSLNGTLLGNATYGINRTDVCAKYPGRPGCTTSNSGVGWTITFNSSKLAAGSTNTLQVTATDSTGLTKTATKNFVIPKACGSPGAQVCQGGGGSSGGGAGGTNCPAGDPFCQGHMPEGDIDEINDLDNIKPANTSGTILVTGWAIDGKSDRTKESIDHVEIYVDRVDASHDMGTAKYGYKNAVNYYRRDVCQRFGNGDRQNIPCPNIGWSYELNTVKKGIGDGRHTLIAKIVDKDKPARSTILKHTFRVENKSGGGRANIETRPIGMITSPEDYNEATKGPVQKGTFKITGWAMDKDSSISEVSVEISGKGEFDPNSTSPTNGVVDIKGKAILGKGTPASVCSSHKGYVGCPGGNVGWEYEVDTAKLPKVHGLYNVTITVIDSDTPAKHLSEDPCLHPDPNQTAKAQQAARNKCKLGRGNKSADIAYARSFETDIPFSPDIKNIPLGTMDTPGTNNPTLKGTVNFNGWGLDSSADPITPISHVTYSFDDQTAVRAAVYGSGNPRTDVCTAFSNRPGCLPGEPGKVGWQFDVDTTKLSDGAHKVHVNIYDSDPSQHALTIDRDFKVDNPGSTGNNTNLTPDILIESITPGGATTKVSGWALDNTAKAESAIKGVSITLDGNVIGAATYGSNRAAICDLVKGYPGRPGCPNVGWEFTFDSSAVYNGAHTLQATATDSTGLVKSAAVTYTVTNNPTPPAGGGPVGGGPLQTRSTIDRPADPAVGTNRQIHLVYVTPSDGRDRQLDINGRLDMFMNTTNAWMSRQTGGRTLRYDTYGNGAHLDVTFVRTSRSFSYYSTQGSLLSILQSDIQAAGLRNSNTIYAAYFEGGSVYACGVGSTPGNFALASFFSSYTNGGQCQSLDMNPTSGSPDYFDFLMIHEIVHNFGVVQSCAPHFLAGSGAYGHTNEAIDLMNGITGMSAASILDPGNDDYYGVNVPVGCSNAATSPYFK